MAKARQQKKPDYLKELLAALEAGAGERIRLLLSELHPADIANLLESVPPETRPSFGPRSIPSARARPCSSCRNRCGPISCS